jgi:hypothetical protein
MMSTRRYGLYWNRRGELYDVISVTPDDPDLDMCRIINLTSGTESIQPCADALDRHIAVGWFVPCLTSDLDRAFQDIDVTERWQRCYGPLPATSEGMV